MEYYGDELGIEEMRGKKLRVCRNPEELFSKVTMASFEGKPATNNHPSQNLDIHTVGAIVRGHVQNVRQDGEFLVADLYITDAGLISEIENGKKEVSCGYDCLWVPLSETEFEQKDIVGNHVAIVQNGRAGSRVAIKDEEPEKILVEGSKRMQKVKMSKKILLAMGFKHFIADAEPEAVADALDAFGQEEEAPAEKPAEKPAAAPAPEGNEEDATKQILAALTQIGEAIKGLTDRVTVLEGGSSDGPLDLGAEDEFASLEKDVTDGFEKQEEPAAEVKDEAEFVEKKEEVADSEEPAAMDALPMPKFISDMKTIIMGIADEKTRNDVAKQFTKSVRDSVASGKNGYGAIVNAVADNKRKAMDEASKVTQTRADATNIAAANWNKNNAHYKGGK
jgi:hypothetical protein